MVKKSHSHENKSNAVEREDQGEREKKESIKCLGYVEITS